MSPFRKLQTNEIGHRAKYKPGFLTKIDYITYDYIYERLSRSADLKTVPCEKRYIPTSII